MQSRHPVDPLDPRACVFCGVRPSRKNRTREHILPKWLLSLTGGLRRVLVLAGKDIAGSPFEVSAGSLQVPACARCNQLFGGLEQLAAPLVRNLMNGGLPDLEGLGILLDWLDKVRHGLWLMDMRVNPGTAQLPVNQYISQRIGLHDRALFVGRVAEDRDCLRVGGPGVLSFQLAPMALMMRVNGLILVSLSMENLLAERAGYPWFELVNADPDSGTAGIAMQPARSGGPMPPDRALLGMVSSLRGFGQMGLLSTIGADGDWDGPTPPLVELTAARSVDLVVNEPLSGEVPKLEGDPEAWWGLLFLQFIETQLALFERRIALQRRLPTEIEAIALQQQRQLGDALLHTFHRHGRLSQRLEPVLSRGVDGE